MKLLVVLERGSNEFISYSLMLVGGLEIKAAFSFCRAELKSQNIMGGLRISELGMNIGNL